MNKNLLIIGAGVYGVVAKEIAESMGCFEKIAFVDDKRTMTPNEEVVIGTTKDIGEFVIDYNNVIVAIGNPEVRLAILQKLEEEVPCNVVTLLSPKAYVAPSATIMKGCIVEPMAVIQSGSVLTTGCIVSAGAVVNHASMLCDGVHIDCNATVAGNTLVPEETKVNSGTVFRRESMITEELFFDKARGEQSLNEIRKKKPHGPVPIEGLEYTFESGI